jgi:hypothetical protein
MFTRIGAGIVVGFGDFALFRSKYGVGSLDFSLGKKEIIS